MSKVYILDTRPGIEAAVDDLLGRMEKERPLLKSSRDVYIKVNGVHCKDYSYTSPALLKASIEALFGRGARNVFVIENSTIGNVTRLVFALTGYKQICRETGARPIYLDEERTETVRLNTETEIRVPKTVMKIVRARETSTYIDLPKLKTHNATVVTLGLKNQFGFFSHADRKQLHDDRLHGYIADFFAFLRPDLTIIDAQEAVSGEMPIAAFKDKQIRPLDLLVGGWDPLAVDVVGARILGYGIEDVPHLKMAAERGLGEGDLKRIACEGESLERLSERTDWDLVDQFPADVKIIRGRQKICREGCDINTLSAVQMLVYDYGGKGGFFVLMGRGFDDGLADRLAEEGYTKGFLAGSCAIEDVGREFCRKFGKKNILSSDACCNVAATVNAMVKLTSLSTFDLIPASKLKALGLFVSAKLHGSRAILAKLF